MVPTSHADDPPVSRAELLTELSACLAEAMAAEAALHESGEHHAVVTAMLDGVRPLMIAIPAPTLIEALQRRIRILGAPEHALAAALAPPAAQPRPDPRNAVVILPTRDRTIFAGPFRDHSEAHGWMAARDADHVIVAVGTLPACVPLTPPAEAEARLFPAAEPPGRRPSAGPACATCSDQPQFCTCNVAWQR